MNDAEPQKCVIPDPDKAYRYAVSWLLEYMKLQANHYLFAENPIFDPMIMQYNHEYLEGFASESPKWKASKKALEEIAFFCKAHDLPLMVVILPDFTQRFDDSYEFEFIHNTVAQCCRKLDLRVIDFLPFFIGKDRDDYWVKGDGHPNALANRCIAANLCSPVMEILGNRLKSTSAFDEPDAGNRR
jgi:hypothetical protein